MPASVTSTSTRKTTPRFTLVLLWILASAFNYGYGISELNPLQPILTCNLPEHVPSSGRPPCTALTDHQFGLVTSLFTLGGLVSSFAISPLASALQWGRRPAITLSAVFGILGSAILATSHSLVPLGLGRFVQGLGSGIGVVIVPIFINEISPASLIGSNGVLNQLSIVLGIFTAQSIGASPLVSPPDDWRWVPLVSLLVSATQLVASFLIGIESPGWLEGEGSSSGSVHRAQQIRALLWSHKEVESHREQQSRASSHSHPTRQDDHAENGVVDEQALLLSDSDQASQCKQLGLKRVLSDASVRPGLVLVVLTQLAQQLSGVNAVLYYSTAILSTLLPSLAGSIGVLITVINMLMTFPPIFLISEHRLGRKRLMVLSASVMSVSSLLLGAGIIYNLPAVSAVSIVLVIAAFSIGLGPVPFVILPELVPNRVSQVVSCPVTTH